MVEGAVEMIDSSTCTSAGWAYSPGEITDNMFCAGFAQGGINICQVGQASLPNSP